MFNLITVSFVLKARISFFNIQNSLLTASTNKEKGSQSLIIEDFLKNYLTDLFGYLGSNEKV